MTVNGMLTEVNETAAPSARASRSMGRSVASMRLGGPTAWSSLLPDTAVGARLGSLAFDFLFPRLSTSLRGCDQDWGQGRGGAYNEAAPPPRGKYP